MAYVDLVLASLAVDMGDPKELNKRLRRWMGEILDVCYKAEDREPFCQGWEPPTPEAKSRLVCWGGMPKQIWVYPEGPGKCRRPHPVQRCDKEDWEP